MKHFKNDGKLKLLIIVGTRPEIIRLAAVINKCRIYFDCLLAHTGQNYDYNLNGVFFKDLKLADPDIYMEAVGDDLGATMGNIIDKSYKVMVETKPDAVLVLGDTNSCLSVIGAKRLHIPIFHMEAGNRCKDECLPEETNRRIVDIISDVNMAYSEHARRYLADCGLPKERTYVTGSPMAEVLHENLAEIGKQRLALKNVSVVVQLGILLLLLIVFIVNLADNLFKDIFKRDDARCATKLVDHDGDVHLLALELAHEVVNLLGLGYEVGLAGECLPVEVVRL